MLTFKSLNILCLIILFSFFVFNHFIDIPITVYIILIVVWFTLTSIGSFNIGWNYHLKALNKNISIKKRHVAITFDDGPNNIYTPQVLKLLKSYKHKEWIKGKYDSCLLRPEYFYAKLWTRGMASNCFTTRHVDVNKETKNRIGITESLIRLSIAEMIMTLFFFLSSHTEILQ